MGWREWLYALGLLFMAGLLISTLSIMASADCGAPPDDIGATGPWVCNTPTCTWCWEAAPGARHYEVLDPYGIPHVTPVPELTMPPPSRDGSEFDIKVRACDGFNTCSDFATGRGVGVPIGWNPVWWEPERSLPMVIPGDLDPFIRALEETWRFPITRPQGGR